MEIYVLSRGFAQDDDYRWLRITENDQQRKEPPIYEEVIDLIESEAPSVVLVRSHAQLFLLITAIKPEGRKDVWNRQIRISIAWLGKDSDEPVLRRLAARALEENERNSLTEEISRAVTLGGEAGFQVSFQDILQLASIDPTGELPENEPPDTKKKIGRTSPKLKNELSQELKKYHLPTEKGVLVSLVVVTEIKERDTLEKAGVWRGLSSLADTEGWEEIPSSGLSKFLRIFKPRG